MKNGNFVISLDFELMWGVFDNKTIENYGTNILGARNIISKMLEVFKEYDIKATWATVGFLFYDKKEDLVQNLPKEIPIYEDSGLASYSYMDSIGENELTDKFHFAKSLIELIKSYPEQEIATHTFSHYYCTEKGSTSRMFEIDLMHAINTAKMLNINIKSIVFPRNQLQPDCLKICAGMGIKTYRGNQKSYLYKTGFTSNEHLLKKAMRFLDSYINLTGFNIYDIEELNKNQHIINIPASSFLRPYSKNLAFFDFLKIYRIKKAMTKAAKRKLTYHLWWHPHNFGINQKKNLQMLSEILEHYAFLKEKYSFTSNTMASFYNSMHKK